MRGVAADLRRFRSVTAGGRRTAPKPLTEREIGPGVWPRLAFSTWVEVAKPSDVD